VLEGLGGGGFQDGLGVSLQGLRHMPTQFLLGDTAEPVDRLVAELLQAAEWGQGALGGGDALRLCTALLFEGGEDLMVELAIQPGVRRDDFPEAGDPFVHRRIDDIHRRLDDLRADMNARFAQAETHMNTRFAQVETQLRKLRQEMKEEMRETRSPLQEVLKARTP
jgi:hypothetical protein